MQDPRSGIKDKDQSDGVTHDVVIRTANVHETSESYGGVKVPRLAGIAKRFHLNDPEQVGLIGLTEPTRKIAQCLYMPGGTIVDDPDDLDEIDVVEPGGTIGVPDDPEDLPTASPDPSPTDNCSATRGLSEALKHEFGQGVTHYHNDNGGSAAKDIGIVMGKEWKKLDAHSRRMGVAWASGPNWDVNWNWSRKLQMVRVLHQPSGLYLRFFCTHFSPYQTSSARKKRKRQANRLVKFLLNDKDFIDKDDPLPPVVVGDFNARRKPGQEPEESVKILEKYFRQPCSELLPLPGGPPRPLIDQVLIGRREHFPHIRFDFKTMAHRRITLTHTEEDSRGRPFTVLTEDGFPRGPLSDHGHSEGFRFRIYKV